MSHEPPAPPPPAGGQPPEPPSYGSPPPTGGGYGAPPPADGGYGAQPPGGAYGAPPSGGGYGAPPGHPGQWDVGSAVSYGWNKFQANMGQMILAALAIFAGLIVIYVIGFFVVLGPALTGSDAGGFVSLILFALLYVVMFIYAQVVGAGLIRESLKVTNGQQFTTAGVFKFDNIGPVIVTSLLVGLGTFIGTVLCVIPGLIFGFLTMFALFFVVDRNLQPVDAIKASIDLVRNNLGPTIIWYLVAYVIVLVGSLLCGIGLLVAIPVMLLGSAYTYKTLTGQPVAP